MHACDGGDPERAGELLWPMIPRYMTTGRWPEVAQWLARFHDPQIANCAELAASAAHCALAAGDVDAARRWALHAAAAIERETPRARESSLSAGIAVIDAMAATPGVAAMRAAASRACAGGAGRQPVAADLPLAVGTAAYLAGSLRPSEEILEEATAIAGSSVPSVTALCLAQRATIALHRQEWELATDHATRAIDVVRTHGLTGEPVSAFALAAAAATSAHDGRSDEAKRDVRASLDLLTTQSDSIAWYGAEVRILLAWRGCGSQTSSARARCWLRRRGWPAEHAGRPCSSTGSTCAGRTWTRSPRRPSPAPRR